MNLREWNQRELKRIKEEANSAENRYFFWLHYRREAYNEAELQIYYVLHGGGKKFHEEHKNERDDV